MPPQRHNDNRDLQVMTFAVRYPHALGVLREAGAHLGLKSDWARRLWEKLEVCDAEEILHELDESEKHFWIKCRTATAPLNNEQGELAALRQMLEGSQRSGLRASFSTALRHSVSDPESDILYLEALQHSLNELKKAHTLRKGERTDGEY